MTGRTDGARRVATLLLAAGVVAAVFWAVFRNAAHTSAGNDADLFAYFGWRVAHGATPYVDVWDNKPPLIWWLDAAALRLAGDSETGIAALLTLLNLVALAALFDASRRLYSFGTALIVTGLGAAYLLHPVCQGGANRTETLVFAFELLAAAACVRAVTSRRTSWWLLAGIGGGLAFLSKQIGLAALLAINVHTLIAQPQRRVALRRLWIGAGSVIAAAALVLAAQGALDDAWHAVVGFNRAYLGDADGRLGFGARAVQMAQRAWVLAWPLLLLALGGATLGVGDLRGRGWLIVWTLLAAAGAILSPGGFATYLTPLFAPCLLLAGAALERLAGPRGWATALRRRAITAAALVAVAFAAMPAIRAHVSAGQQVWRQRMPYWCSDRFAPKLAPTAREKLGTRIAELTAPDATIQGIGYLPSVYLSARRPNAHRLVTTEKLGHVADARSLRNDWWQAVRNDPPAVLFTSRAAWRALWSDDIATRDQADRWRQQHYEPVETIAGVTLYLLKPAGVVPAADAADNATP